MTVHCATLNRFSTRSLENPTVSLNDVDAWNEMFGGDSKTDSGMTVNQRTSHYVAAVWKVTALISGDVAKLPFNVFKYVERKPGIFDRIADTRHPAWKLIRRQPNDETTANKFWRFLIVQALIYGNAYAFIDRNLRGEPTALRQLESSKCKVDRKAGRLWVKYQTVKESQSYTEALPYDDVLHIRGISFDGVLGAEQLQYAKHVIGLALAMQKYASKFFKNGAKQSGFLTYPPGVTRQFMENAEKAYDKFNADENNWHKFGQLRDGVKPVMTSVDPAKQQLSMQRQDIAREVCMFYGVPPSKLGIKDSVSYNSKEADAQDYLDSGLSPWLEDIAAESHSKLLSEKQKGDDSHFFEHETKALLKLKATDESQVINAAVQNRTLLRSEARQIQNLPYIEGTDEFDEKPAGPAGGLDKGGNSPPRGEGDRMALRRATFTLGVAARHKATRGGSAWGKFTESGLDEFEDCPLKDALRDADMVKEDQLEEHVAAICEQAEREACT